MSLVLQDQSDQELCVAQTLALTVGLVFVTSAGPFVKHLAVSLERRRARTVSQLLVLYSNELQLLGSPYALGGSTSRRGVRVGCHPFEQLMIGARHDAGRRQPPTVFALVLSVHKRLRRRTSGLPD